MCSSSDSFHTGAAVITTGIIPIRLDTLQPRYFPREAGEICITCLLHQDTGCFLPPTQVKSKYNTDAQRPPAANLHITKYCANFVELLL